MSFPAVVRAQNVFTVSRESDGKRKRFLRWQITLNNAEDRFNLGLNVSKLAIL